MSRLFMISVLGKWVRAFVFLGMLLASLPTNAQSYTQMVEFADEKMVEGDYYYAIFYYEQAMKLDSNSVEILWKFAEAQRKYKNYPKAEYYYQKVYDKENAKIYPLSIFWLASMQHLNGKYEASFENWKIVKKVFKRDRKSYAYLKAQQEFRSCLWAQKAVNDTTKYRIVQLPEPVNSMDAELAPLFFNGKMYYTSLKADSINHVEEVYTKEYSLQIYSANKKDTVFSNISELDGVRQSGFHGANGSFSPDGQRFYFSRCDGNFNCKIYVGKVKGDKIVEIDSLGEVINEPGAITTMPHATLINGQEYLFFCSNRTKTVGGLDIWVSLVKDGNQYGKPRNLGRAINSLDDDICPFYDTEENKLYFSSSWLPGFGGYDLFVAENKNMVFTDPINLGIPINSAQNDTYLVIEPVSRDFYFSSNRYGVMYAKNPTCCNDLFRAHLPIVPPPTRFESLEELNKKLPVTLYFHNDCPNPKTKDTTTNLNYITTYDDYINLKPKYHKEYSAGLTGDQAEEAIEDIDDFFTQYVEQGVLDLQEFTRLLLIELEKGYEIEVTIQGFASPLAATDYNVSLTKRRISSLINYLREYNDGVFVPYLEGTAANGGRLTFVFIPFGEYTADQLISDNPNDQKESIYNRRAGLERKIEIQSVSFVSKDSSYAEMKMNKEVHDFGDSKKGQVLTYEFQLTNAGDDTLFVERIETECECLKVEMGQLVLAPGEFTFIKVQLDTKDLTGIIFKHFYVYSNIKQGRKQITLTTEVGE